MNRLAMVEISKNRNNLVGFLHMSDIAKLDELFDNHFKVDKKSFSEICDAALNAYDSKSISNKSASNIFEILSTENTSLKIESHRFEDHKIYEYDVDTGSYMFLKRGPRFEFNKLNSYLS